MLLIYSLTWKLFFFKIVSVDANCIFSKYKGEHIWCENALHPSSLHLNPASKVHVNARACARPQIFWDPCSSCAREHTDRAVLGRGRKGALQHQCKSLSPGLKREEPAPCGRPTELWQQQCHGEPSSNSVAYIMWQEGGHGLLIHHLLFNHRDIPALSK